MRKNVFLWLLMCCAVLTLTGCGALTSAGNEDGLITTGYYSWNAIPEKGEKPKPSQPIYIETSRIGFDIYTIFGPCYHVTVINNDITSRLEMGSLTIDLTGKIISRNIIEGEGKTSSVSENKTYITYYKIVPDLAPQKDSDYFKKRHQEFINKSSPRMIPKETEEERLIRENLEKKAKENQINSDVSGNEDGLIKTGFYLWKTSSEKGAKPKQDQPTYIETSRNGFDMYTTGGFCYHVIIKDNEIASKYEIGQQTIDITGKIISKELIDGECKRFSDITGKTDIAFFTIIPDLAPQKDADYFKKQHQEFEERNNRYIISKTSEDGKKMRTLLERLAKEEDISFVVKGKIIDSIGQPVEGFKLRLSARSYDPDGPMEMKDKILYVISNKDGFFESEPLIGHLLGIYYNGKDYQPINEYFKGKDKLLELKDKPIIIKLEPNIKAKTAIE